MLTEEQIEECLYKRIEQFKHWKELLWSLREENDRDLLPFGEKLCKTFLMIYKAKITELCLILGKPSSQVLWKGMGLE